MKEDVNIQESINKWDTYSWGYKAQVMDMYKPKIIYKLATIMGKKDFEIHCRGNKVKRYLKNVYNIEIKQTIGWRTLVINGKPHISVNVSATNYAFAELGLIDLACNIIMESPDFVPGKKEVIPSAEQTIEDHLYRVFGYKLANINSVIERRIRKEFGYSINIVQLSLYDEVLLQVEIFQGGVLIHTEEETFETIKGRIPWHWGKYKRGRKELINKAWKYILAKLPTYNSSTKKSELLDLVDDFEQSIKSISHIGDILRDAINSNRSLGVTDYDSLMNGVTDKLKNIIRINNKRINL